MTTGGVPSPAPAPAPAPTPEPVAAPWAAAGTETWKIGDKPWFEHLPEGPEREYAKTKNFSNPALLAKTAYEQERVISSRDDSKMVRIPDPNATPQDWDAFYSKLGRPADVKGYDEVKFGENADPAMTAFAKEMAFKLGLPPKALESIMVPMWNEFASKLNGDAEQTTVQANNAALAELRTAWGDKFEENQARGRTVLSALTKAGLSEADLAAVEKHVGIAPVVKLLATIGKLSGEGNLVDPTLTKPGDPSSMTPEQAKSEIERLQADEAFSKAYYKKEDPGNAAAVQKMEALYAKAGNLIKL